MNVLILGAGEVGFSIAQRLASENCNVVVVDRDAALLKRVADSLDVKTVCGHASLPSVLAQANAANADLLVAATTNDELNMMACQVAHSLFKVPTKLARVRESEYVEHAKLCGRDDLPIDLMISPEREAAKAIVQRFQVSSAADAQEFAGGKTSLVGLRIPPKSALAGISLKETSEAINGIPVIVVAHEHNQTWHVPSGDAVLLAGDTVYVAMAKTNTDAFMDAAGLECSEVGTKHVMMVGGGHIGFVVAQHMEALNVSLKIIEFNEERAQWLAEHLSKATVIHGDAMDRKLLEEENISEMDDFLALTNDDETNILVSLIAKKYKVPHIVTLVNRSIYTDLISQIGLDVTVSPRLTTVSSVLSYIRKGRILGMSSLGDGSIEVLEAEALETSKILNTPLRELELPEETVVGAILRDGEVVIPDGSTEILAHDHVMMVTRSSSVVATEKLFEVHLEFF
ncbi:MAG: Trk system potassium transporter TrkA [Zetaproteobacteria bacterium CG12_big_fil_rev_8_21_14_0_65_55_1124]|nr:MAG: Trk system potassium transport protein TrkA [Zetaproteobacteria bacterium CG1_02_55_237]PIS19737.1 MAG: Trk system potassium transporter TrkA [Zetaproteobacteria bacterium CG08_land_8_20_14_0_20_55_17]PIW43503.1 MAG: Trk system potassium transporter TrkA [Zetaproteobacteria bacterium CG12_big_fil_rev_8_21_14_0_65_55_1124]PIY54133.1 MAG: Trk system potassium transporter TrkA [Zetaproteobacteria bacterium CG_4_10_14_0_8_um_filter_55_43]PIZ39128.1 MAG: Trk system potassium transporter TrkA